MSQTSLCCGDNLSGKWTIGNKLGEGAFAEVFEVFKQDEDRSDFVAKCIPISKGKPKGKANADAKRQKSMVDSLFYEHTLYNGLLLGFKFAPLIPKYAYGEDKGYRYLIMQRLDMDLQHFSRLSSNGPSVKSIANIGLQILEGLEILHKKGFIFVDVKPENFMLLKSRNSEKNEIHDDDRLFFIDYGLVEKFTQYTTGGCREQTDRGGVAGTPTFVSLSVHGGSTPSRKDDVEALGYVLLSLRTQGKLPWSDATSDEDCKRKKVNCNINQLASELGCEEVGQIITTVRQLAFEQTPCYDEYKSILQRMAVKQEVKPSKKRNSGAALIASPAVISKKSTVTTKKSQKHIQEVEIVEEETIEEIIPKSSTSSSSSTKSSKSKKPLPVVVPKSTRGKAAVIVPVPVVVDVDVDVNDNWNIDGVPAEKSRRRGVGSGSRKRDIAQSEIVFVASIETESESQEEMENKSANIISTSSKTTVNATAATIVPNVAKGAAVMKSNAAAVKGTSTPIIVPRLPAATATASGGTYHRKRLPGVMEEEETAAATTASHAPVTSPGPFGGMSPAEYLQRAAVEKRNSSSNSSSSSSSNNTLSQGKSSGKNTTSSQTLKASSSRSRTPLLRNEESPSKGSGSEAGGLRIDVVLEVTRGPYLQEIFSLSSTGSENEASKTVAPIVGRTKRSPVRDQEDDVYIVGRGEDNHICLSKDDYISEKHLSMRLRVAEEGLLGFDVMDLGSTNGSKLNDNTLMKKRWVAANVGDIITVGQSQFKITVRVRRDYTS